jgi:uncharacterized membrane protein YraQ (UPF0718 family)
MSSKSRRFQRMLIPTIIIGVIAIVLLFIGYQRGGGEHILGLKAAGNMLMENAPLLIFAFIVAGMIPIFIPQEIIARWIGGESGLRGVLIGTIMGSLTPMGPFVSMPIGAGLLRAGANVGTIVAFITAWSLLGVSRLPLEVGILGWKFMLIRLACVLFLPPVAGLIGNKLFSGISVV